MKKFIPLMFIIALSGVMFVSDSCKKKTHDPDYPELVGSWVGTTDQSRPMKIVVDNFDGELRVTYAMVCGMGDPGFDSSVQYNSDGLVALSGKTFNFVFDDLPKGGTFITGIFRTDSLSLSGTYKITWESTPDMPLTGTYTASKK